MKRSPRCLGLLLVPLLMSLAGCETIGARQDTLAGIEASLEQAAASQRDLPAEVSDALLPTIRLDAAELPHVESDLRFDISVSNVPAEQFFMSLVDGTPYNMVVHPEVRGSISLNLKNVTIPDVMEAVRDVYGFEFNRTPYGFQVLPSRLVARIYQINYLNIDRSGSSSTFVSSGALTQGPDAGAEGLDRGMGQVFSGGRRQRSVIGTQINTQQPETTFWFELETAILAIIGQAEGRSVVVNPQSGVVVVRAIPNELREVEAFLRATQLIVQRQVILEARILEVELAEGFQAGINWAALLGDFTVGTTGGGTVFSGEQGLSDIAAQAGNLDPANFSAIAGNLASAFGGVFTLAVNSGDFRAFIELLETQGNVQVLSSPRIATLNNQKAVIKVGSDEFFVTDVSTTTITGTTTTSTPNVELTPFFSGIALDVTPQISEAGDVTLHVHPSVSDVVDQQKTITVGGITQQLPLARSTVRESDSIVRARSGQVVVIGGLMQDQLSDREAKAPVVGNLPVLGNLFKQRRQRALKSELVILLKPIVVDGPEQWTSVIEDTRSGLGRLRETLDGWDARGRLSPPVAEPQP